MKIVQSFWTKPFLQSRDHLADSRLNGGWIHKKYNYFSWAYSCLQLGKFYEKIELITDDLGKQLLIDCLELPYTNVVAELNALDDYNPGLWALGKIYAYGRQDEPFLHVDNDIFVFRKFDDDLIKSALIAQNIELIQDKYRQTLNDICTDFEFIPGYLKRLVISGNVECSNAGVLGGDNFSFFKEYAAEVFSLVDKNVSSIDKSVEKMNVTYMNVVFEQVVFHVLARMRGLDVTYMFPDTFDIPKNIGAFHGADVNKGYVHCLGVEKKNRLAYSLLEIKLRNEYPAYYNKIIDCLESAEI